MAFQGDRTQNLEGTASQTSMLADCILAVSEQSQDYLLDDDLLLVLLRRKQSLENGEHYSEITLVMSRRGSEWEAAQKF
jgi:hypothetical protein